MTARRRQMKKNVIDHPELRAQMARLGLTYDDLILSPLCEGTEAGRRHGV